MKIDRLVLSEMDKQYRTNLVNSLPGIRGANLIGTINSITQQTNVAIFNSVTHIGANPPLMGFIMRPVSVQRDTYIHIKQNESFTINQVHENIYHQAHQTSARYSVSEFEATGLTPEFTDKIKAPYVKESKIKMGLRFVEELHIKSNETILIIGEIEEIILEDKLLSESGIIQLEDAKAIGVSGLESYYRLLKLEELPYAKP